MGDGAVKGRATFEPEPEFCKAANRRPPRLVPFLMGMRFPTTLPNVQMVLSGMNSPEQILDNAGTFLRLSPLTKNELDTLFKAKELFMEHLGVPCSACRYCCASCPTKLDIPLLIRAYNELRMGGKIWRFAGLVGTKKPESCLGCGTCLKCCPQRINIPEIMKKLAATK